MICNSNYNLACTANLAHRSNCPPIFPPIKLFLSILNFRSFDYFYADCITNDRNSLPEKIELRKNSRQAVWIEKLKQIE